MKIKAKLVLGIGLLFSMIALLTTMSTVYINKLSAETKNILVDNYNTIDYTRNMLVALNNGIAAQPQLVAFQENLKKQEGNISEVGEEELTQKLAQDFLQLKQKPNDSSLVRTVRTDISDIMLMNMQAIRRKSSVADVTADKAIFWISLVGTVCFLIAFILLINLPGNIANPIKELSNSIKQIADQNYSQRVHFESHNEFGELATAFNTMAEKLEEYKASNLEKLMIEKKRIETLIDNMNDPVIGLDNFGLILFMNTTALNITGLKREDALGKLVQNIAVKNDLMRLLIQELFDSKDVASIPKTPIKIYADQKESYFQKEIIPINIVPTGEKAEKQIGNVILLQNITPYKELDFAKTNFIATVSHELKTPISSIKMSIQLLESKQIGTVNDEQKSLLDGIKDDANRLLKITGELLNMTQVESGSIQLKVIKADAEEILQYAIHANKQAAEQKQIKFHLDIANNLPLLMADSDKTAWVLTNLISNALRYSYEHSTVHLKIATVNDFMQFSVADGGQGIAPEYLDKIFDRYFRVPGSKKEGTGLGLSISKEFIEAQGGTLTVTSELGLGSTFTIQLPIHRMA